MRFTLLSFTLVLLVQAATAQRASLRGTISDSTGGVLPGVSIVALNIDQGLKRETETDRSGSFSIPLLQPGNYVVSAEKDGFAILEVTDLFLHVGDARILQLVLPIAKVRVQIRVNDRTGGVETVSPTLGQVVNGEVIQNAPLDGRNILELAVLQPGVLPVNADAAGVTGFSVAGNREDSVTFLLDGAHNNDLLNNGITYNPNPDTIAEFRVMTSNYTADFGRNGGGIVTFATKSGTNFFHGSAYDYLRNEALDANTFFNKNNAYRRPILKRNQFGGSLGGPLAIPEVLHREDRAFFFVSYQGELQAEQIPPPSGTTFTPAELTGDFHQDPSVIDFLVHHPTFAQGNPQNGIIKIDPIAQNYIKAGLIPSTPDGKLTALGRRDATSNEITAKVDFELTEKDRLSVTLGGDHTRNVDPFDFANVGGFSTVSQPSDRFVNGTYTHIFSSRLLDEFHLAAQRAATDQERPLTHQPGPSDLGILDVRPDLITGPPDLTFQSGFQAGFAFQGPTHFADNTFSAANALTWSRGQHTWKLGAGFAAYQNNTAFAFLTDGLFEFSNIGTADGFGVQSPSGSLPNFLLGLPALYIQGPNARSNIRSKTTHAFLQDEWRVNQRLVLSLGLRYEYSTPKSDTQGRSYSIVPGQHSQVFPNAPVGMLFPGDPHAPTGANFPDKNDFAPRFGFAWDLSGKGKTSLRGGFGVFYNILKADDNLQFNGQPPFYSTAGINFFAPSTTAPLNYLAQPFTSTNTPNPFPSKPPDHNIDFSSNGAGFLPIGASGSVFVVDPHLRTPYIYQYNLSLQHDLGANTVIELNYVGSSARKLTSLVQANPFQPGGQDRVLNVFPGNSSCSDQPKDLRTCSFAAILEYANVSSANFNSLEGSLRKQISHNRWFGDSYFTLAYTWSHNIDNASGSSLQDNRNAEVPVYNHNLFRASSDFDLRHRIVFSGGWTLPVAELWAAAPKPLVEGWRVFPIVRWRTGFPLDVFANLPTAGDFNDPGPSGAGDLELVRANLTSPVRIRNPHDTGHYWFDPASFVQPSDTPTTPTYGTLSRNSFRGPGSIRTDLAVAKETLIAGERTKMEFRADFFNVFNHTNFADPSTNINDAANFGKISFAADPRIIQLSLRLSF